MGKDSRWQILFGHQNHPERLVLENLFVCNTLFCFLSELGASHIPRSGSQSWQTAVWGVFQSAVYLRMRRTQTLPRCGLRWDSWGVLSAWFIQVMSHGILRQVSACRTSDTIDKKTAIYMAINISHERHLENIWYFCTLKNRPYYWLNSLTWEVLWEKEFTRGSYRWKRRRRKKTDKMGNCCLALRKALRKAETYEHVCKHFLYLILASALIWSLEMPSLITVET